MGVEDFIKFSVCDLLKKGIGSSSSHTLAPWLAARCAYSKIKNYLQDLEAIKVDLYGSLACVGRGHYTDVAIPLGLLDKDEKTFDISSNLSHVLGIKDVRWIGNLDTLSYPDGPSVPYSVQYNIPKTGEEAPEMMEFSFTWAKPGPGKPPKLTYYSYGGGSWGPTPTAPPLYPALGRLSYEYDNAEILLKQLQTPFLSDAIYWNEEDFARYRGQDNGMTYKDVPIDPSQIVPYLKDIAVQMGKLIFGGFTWGEHDTCYQVMYAKKRAKELFERLYDIESMAEENSDWAHFLGLMRSRSAGFGFDKVTELVGAMALAVAEQNAALKNVVTAPTNGACGVVPAVLYYYILFHAPESEARWLFDDNSGENADSELNNICRFLLVANAVGGIVKANANIAGGLGGCQAEIGTAAAMAAGGLAEALDGGPVKIFQAAEAALEAHLGSTCDPVGGLVEIPCIERNLSAAVTAISVSLQLLALDRQFETVVPFDKVVETMENISNNMDMAYKETSTGGLAKTMLEDVKEKRPDLFPDGSADISEGQISVFRVTC
ncbi:MAG: hypothetical protein GY906_03830 [bacterium]|nr:hypothetical protein [bacterium]